MIHEVKAILKQKAPHFLLVVGTGGQSTRETISLTQAAAKAGADCALVITPGFFKDYMTSDALVQYYTQVADASPIPLIIYNVPKYAQVDIPNDAVAKLCKHPKVIGIKCSGGNITKIAQFVHDSKGQNFQVLAGSAGFLLPALAVGAVGGVCALANIAAEKCHEVLVAWKKGDHADAWAKQAPLIAANTAVTGTFGVSGLKYCHDLVGLQGGFVRGPLQELSMERKAACKKIMEQSGIIVKSHL